MNCSKVMAIQLPANLKNIKPYTFYNCFSDLPFKEDPGEDFKLAIKIPDAVESIGEYAFYGCDFMESEKELNSSSFDYYAYVYSLGLSEVSIGNGVKTIGDHAFDGCRHLVKVDMAPSVTSIGQYAFNDCFAESAYSAIKEKRDRSGKPVAGVKVEELWKRDLNPDSITLPDSLTTLGEAAFSGCALLPGINFPDGLTQIPAYAFDGCRSLPLLRLGDGVTTIGPSAFDGCTGVTEIHIPATLINASRAFVDCEKALTVYYYASEPWEHFDEAFFSPKVYASEEATLIAKAAPISVLKQTSPWALFHIIDASDQTLEHNVGALQPTDNLRFRVLSNTPHRYCEVAGPYQEASSYVIPEKVLNINEDDPTNYGQYYTVIRIGNDAFENNLDLTEITIPATVIEIGQEAFNGCQNLTTINYAEDGLYITNMGERAFADCDALTYFKVPKGVTRLNTEVLKDCRGLLTIEMHPGVTELGKGALMDCRHLREFKYADGWNLEIIDDYALKNCIELTAVNIPYGVTKIGNEAFYYCQKLLKANLPSTLTEIGENAFENCEVLETINMFNVGDSIPELTGNPGLKNPLCRIYVQHTSLDAYRQAFPMLSHRILSAISIVPPASNKLRFVPDTPLELELIKNVPHTSLTWSSSNDEFVPVASGEGDAIYLKGVGITTVTVETDKHLYANYFNHECELKVYPQRADANWDGAFDISDAVNIAYYVVKNDDELINAFSTRTDMNEEEWNDFYYEGANLNGDRHISFADASAAMKEVLNQNPDGALTPGRSAGADPDADALIVGTNMTAADGGAMMIPVGLDSRTELVALQANIRVPEGIALVDVAAGEGAAGHTLSSRRIDSRTMRVILFDLSNSTFAADGSPLLRLTVKGGEIGPDDIEISGIVASDITSRSHQLIARPGQVIPTPTGVDKVSADDDTEALSPGAISASADGIVITASRGSKVMVCTVDGRVVRSLTTSSGSESISLPKGIYLVSVNGSATKIAVK